MQDGLLLYVTDTLRYENFGFGTDLFAEAFETLASVIESYEVLSR